MIPEIKIRPEAEEDLTDAAIWYEEQCVGLGNEFLDRVLSTFKSIAAQPGMYPVVHSRTRRALMHRFPFGIYYCIESDSIVVLAVMHGSRHPRLWKDRTEPR